MAGRVRIIFYDALLEAFDQCTFTPLTVLKQPGLTLGTENFDGATGRFLVGAGHGRIG